MKLRLPLFVLCLAFLALLSLASPTASVAENTGPHLFASVINDPSYGNIAWSNPSNARTCDDNRSETVVSTGIISHWLKATNAGFAVPSSATVTSIEIIIEAQVSGYVGDLSGLRVMLLKAGTPIVLQGLDIAPSTTDVTYIATIPSPWAQLWTPADVNASDFGVQMYAHTGGDLTVNIDCLSVNAYYLPTLPYALHLPLVARQ